MQTLLACLVLPGHTGPVRSVPGGLVSQLLAGLLLRA